MTVPFTAALLDANVLLERHAFFAASAAVWKKCDDGVVEGWISAVTVTTIFYVGRKLKGADRAREAVATCLKCFQVVPVNGEMLEPALAIAGADYEDDVQAAPAAAATLPHIVTRNTSDFVKSRVPAVTPEQFLDLLARLPSKS